jgi:hypothetical protein
MGNRVNQSEKDWTGAEFDFRKKGKQRKMKIPLNDLKYIKRDAAGEELQDTWTELCSILKARGLQDQVIYANNLAYIVGFSLGNTPLSAVQDCLIQQFPRISRHLDYWRADFPKGWFYYRNGVKDSNPNSTTFSPYREKYLK